MPASWINKTIYVKFTLQNSSAMRDTVYFYPGNSFRNITLHKILPSDSFLKLTDESKEDGFQPVYFSANDKTSFIAELHLTKRKFNAFALEIIKKKYLPQYQKILYTSNYNALVIGYLLSAYC